MVNMGAIGNVCFSFLCTYSMGMQNRLASYNFAEGSNDPLPPDPTATTHGTMCAGVVAMARDNGICGAGAAYDVSIGG